MPDVISSAAAALQASLVGQLARDLAQAVANGTVSNAPPQLQNPAQPIAVTGTVTSQTFNGSQNSAAVVQTAAGPLTLSLPSNAAPLPQGTVTVVIQPGNPPSASIMASQPQAAQEQAPIQPQTTVMQAAQQAQAQIPLPPLAVGQVLTATALPTPLVAPPAEDAHTLAPATPPPVVGAAAAASGAVSSQAVATPTAVLLSSAVAPVYVAAATADPAPRGIPQPDEPEETAAETPVPASYFPQSAPFSNTSTALAGQQAASLATETAAGEGWTPQASALAAQESASETSAPLLRAAVPETQAAPQPPQNFVVLSIQQPDTAAAPLVVGQMPPATVPAATPSGQTVMATVVAQTGSGQPLLATDNGPMLVHEAVSTSVGTGLVLQKLPDQPTRSPVGQSGVATASAGTGPAALDRTPLSLSRQPSWPALTQLMTTLNTAAPGTAGFLGDAVPTLGSGFVQAFVRFLIAGNTNLSAAEAPQLTAAGLSRTGAGTAGSADFKATILQAAADIGLDGKTSAVSARADSWHNYQVPMMTDQGINMAQLFVRQQIDPIDDEPGSKKGGASTRFVVEIHPAQIGPVQLDGLLRKGEGRIERLDLIVRTEFDVPSEASDEMQDVFRSALVSTGMAGKLGFQSGSDRFVLPESDGNTRYSGKI